MNNQFYEFWQMYAPQKEFKNRYQVCEKVWNAMDERNRRLIMRQLEQEKTNRSPPVHKKNPYFFLIDWQQPQPHWLSPAETGQMLAKRLPLAVCRNPVTGLFGTVTKEEADVYELEVHHYM